MYHLRAVLGLLAVLAAGACLCGCGGQSFETQAAPAGIDVARGSSSVTVPVVGDSFTADHGTYNRPGESSPNGHIIAPGGDDDLAWAKYCIKQLKKDRPIVITIDVLSVIAPGGDDDLPLMYWVMTYDFTGSCWITGGPYEETTELVLNSKFKRNRMVSADNEFNFLILTDASQIEPSEDNPLGLTAVEIACTYTQTDSEYTTTIPHYPIITDLRLGNGKGTSALDPDTQYVTIEWEHVEDSSDWKNEAQRYEVWRSLVGGKKDPKLLGKVDAPTSVFVDPLDIEAGVKHAVPGASYVYYVCSINVGGKTPLAPAGPITVPFYPPTDLAAGDGEFTDRIVLSWTKAEGATSYEIYRDSQDQPVATVGDVATWIDTSVDDADQHTYWLKSVNEFATSDDFSAGDQGHCGS